LNVGDCTPVTVALDSSYMERVLKIIQRFGNQVPAMASCTNCQYKFLTPSTLQRDPEAAGKYLREKFYFHKCRDERK
jgi:hypothetical protein